MFILTDNSEWCMTFIITAPNSFPKQNNISSKSNNDVQNRVCIQHMRASESESEREICMRRKEYSHEPDLRCV